MEKTWTVYMHTNKINNKVYVGITSQKVKYRWGKNGEQYLHKENSRYKQPKFANAIMKYGWDNFEHIIFAEGLTHDEACKAESLLIRIWDSVNNGYNVTFGGEGCVGLVHSEETKRKISASTKGEKNHFYGGHHTEESKMLISEAHSRPVCQFDIDLNFIKEYKNTKYASECTGISQSSIAGCCYRLYSYKTAGGYVWIYKDEIADINKAEYKAWLLHEKLPKPVCKFSFDMEFIEEYVSISEAARINGIAASDISKACANKLNQAHGYLWILKEDYEKMKRGEIAFKQPHKKRAHA